MRVIVMPPYGSIQPGYVIADFDEEPPRYATEDGAFVDHTQAFFRGEVIQFPTARDAITFAELNGWVVMNKASDGSIWNPPMR